jgi:hypothetical protein
VCGRLDDPYPCRPFPQFQHPQNLTHLSISYNTYTARDPVEGLKQLSSLVNLQYLGLYNLNRTGVPGGWPSELTQLTRLHAHYIHTRDVDIAQQFQHLSCLTALQELAGSPEPGQSSLPGMQHLSQLTSLTLHQTGDSDRPGLELSTAITHSWACRTALQELALMGCAVQSEALTAFSQLQSLCLSSVKHM